MSEHINQDEINQVWSKVWQVDLTTETKDFFKQRLFVEGYPVFKKYFPPDAKKILDAGGGSGRYGIKLASDYHTTHVIVADIVAESLVLGQKIASDLKVDNVQFEREDLNKLSYRSESFDLVFCDVVLQHLPNPLPALTEIRRILAPNGRFIIAVNNYWSFHTLYKFSLKIFGRPYRYGYEQSYTHQSLKKILTDQGLRVIAQDGFYPAYGVYRLKYLHPIFGWLGKVLNRLTKILDFLTGRFFSYHFGMEIIAVGEKLEL